MPFSKNGTWVRKSGNELFGITKGSFGGVEICELVGHYLLNRLSKILRNDNVGLYRDNRLAALKSTTDPILDKISSLFLMKKVWQS